MSTATTVPTVSVLPWWRVGVMWLFVGGLGAVVIASFALLATAMEQMDQVETQQPVAQTVALPAGQRADAPALQARNHAATPARRVP